jgi:hypothetical protein
VNVNQTRVEGGPIGDLLAGLANDVQQLIRGEIALGRAEVDQKLQRMIRSAVWLVGGALLGFAGLVVLLEGGAGVLAPTIGIPLWAAALIVGVVIIALGVAFAWSGLAAMSLKQLAPERTVSNIQKDVQVMKEHG